MDETTELLQKPEAGIKEQQQQKQGLATKRRHRLLIITACCTLLFVGSSLGYGPMQLILEENGSFSSQCTPEQLENNEICDEQAGKLVSIGLSMTATQILAPLLGWMADHIGPQRAAYVQASMAVIGLSLVFIGVSTLQDTTLFTGFVIYSLHTWMGTLMIVQLGLYFTGHQISRTIFILNSLFDSGAITWLGLRSTQQALDLSTPSLIACYLALAVLLYGIAAYFWTVTVHEQDDDGSSANQADESTIAHNNRRHSSISFQFISRSSHRVSITSQLAAGTVEASRSSSFIGNPHVARELSRRMLEEIDSSVGQQETLVPHRRTSFQSFRRSSVVQKSQLLALDDSTLLEDDVEGEKQATSAKNPKYIAVANRKADEQLTSTPFILLCIFFSVHVATENWNFNTQRPFLAFLGDDEAGNLYLTIFTLLTPVSILGSFLIDWTILNVGWMKALESINLLAIIYQLIKVTSKSLQVQIIGFVIFSFYRSFLFGVTFSFLPTLVSGDVAGKAAGIMTGLSGLVNMGMFPLSNLAIKNQNGDFQLPNVILLCLTAICGFSTIHFLGNYVRLEEEALEGKEGYAKAGTSRKSSTISISEGEE